MPDLTPGLRLRYEPAAMPRTTTSIGIISQRRTTISFCVFVFATADEVRRRCPAAFSKR